MTDKETFFKNNTLPEISPDEITFGPLLGKGAFSKVYQGKCRGQEVAVKIFEGAKNDEQELESIRAEIKVMSQIYNQNVVLFLGACTDPNKELMIVTEKLPSDLNKLLIEQKDKYPLSLRKRMKMAKEAALGVNWLHCSNPMFIHRDLKPSNLLVSEDYHVKVADFGLTKMKDKTSKKQNNAPQGSPAYMAPEVFMGEYDEKCDVYSFGMVLWEIYQQEKVFKDYPNLPSLMHAVIDEGVRPDIPKNCPSRLRKLMQRCWDEDPKKRPSMSKVVTELENVILDVSIQDHTARKMWREKLSSENSVPWNVFAKCVCQELQYEATPTNFDDFNNLPLDLKCLQEIVATKSKNKKIKINNNSGYNVKVKLFGAMVQCFGPFDKGFLKRVSKLICSKWFHGNANQQEAENTLTKSDTPGAFLVRFSSSPGYFTLSVLVKKQMEHHRIINVPGHGCYVWSTQFPDIFEVIKEGKNRKLLKKPCSGSPYKHLYDAKKKSQQLGSNYINPSQTDINRAHNYN